MQTEALPVCSRVAQTSPHSGVAVVWRATTAPPGLADEGASPWSRTGVTQCGNCGGHGGHWVFAGYEGPGLHCVPAALLGAVLESGQGPRVPGTTEQVVGSVAPLAVVETMTGPVIGGATAAGQAAPQGGPGTPGVEVTLLAGGTEQGTLAGPSSRERRAAELLASLSQAGGVLGKRVPSGVLPEALPPSKRVAREGPSSQEQEGLPWPETQLPRQQ